jgi:hypothetical protein
MIVSKVSKILKHVAKLEVKSDHSFCDGSYGPLAYDKSRV